MRLYTYGAVGDFAGEIVLDPFVGTGMTCAVAKAMGRRYVGIDINPAYVALAQQRIREAAAQPPRLLVGRAKYPGQDELAAMAAASSGRSAERKHKRKTFGRKVKMKRNEPLTLA
jgi:ubiquinone/menaquinone biosynthesis C-methylase UbiE